MFDQLLNEAFQGMKMLSPCYWIILLLTIIIVVIVVITICSSPKYETKRDNIFSLIIFIAPYAPFIISSLLYLITNATITFALILNWIFALVGSAFLYFLTTAVLTIALGICLIGLDSINVITFHRDKIFDVFFCSSFGFIYTYAVISFVLFNQFYWLFR